MSPPCAAISPAATARPRPNPAPFAAKKPENIDAGQWAALQARARTLITTKVHPSYQAFADLYDLELKNKCRQSVGVSAMPQGAEYYAFQVRQQTFERHTA